MAVKIRLQRKGRRKKPFYHIVIADSRAPRDGKFIERIGSYNPMTSPATITLDFETTLDWLEKGAVPTDTARAILRFKGVLYRKHLNRGVNKGAFSQEDADRMFAEFIQAKEAKIAERFKQSADDRKARQATLAGTAPVVAAEVEAESQEDSTSEEE
jgi:small subunit ribosomal protein S16